MFTFAYKRENLRYLAKSIVFPCETLSSLAKVSSFPESLRVCSHKFAFPNLHSHTKVLLSPQKHCIPLQKVVFSHKIIALSWESLFARKNLVFL